MASLFEMTLGAVALIAVGYAFRGFWNRFIKKAGADVVTEADKLKADVKSKL